MKDEYQQASMNKKYEKTPQNGRKKDLASMETLVMKTINWISIEETTILFD